MSSGKLELGDATGDFPLVLQCCKDKSKTLLRGQSDAPYLNAEHILTSQCVESKGKKRSSTREEKTKKGMQRGLRCARFSSHGTPPSTNGSIRGGP